MKIAIQPVANSFSERWIVYCQENDIEYKLVNCYRSDIIQQLSDCEGLMWHFSQNSPKDILFAKQLLFTLELTGKKVFPDIRTNWHFDDKVGQKYLFEALEAPVAPSWVFYTKQDAFNWVNVITYPKVFKLRGGAGSQNVNLVKSRKQAHKLIRRAFGRGFPAFDPNNSLKERWRRYKSGKTSLADLGKGLLRYIWQPEYARIRGRERGYVYFQEFIPNNTFDIRIIVIGKKAFGIKRVVRENDFRASGSGSILYGKEHITDDTLELAFSMSEKIKTQCAAFDFVYSGEDILTLEVSYGFMKEGYDPCPGYWDRELIFHEGKFDPYGWMVEDLLKKIYSE